MTILKSFFDLNRKISFSFDKLLPRSMSIYGTTDFHERLLPAYIQDNWTIYDIGGGKRPFIFPEMKVDKNITLIGVDIDETELRKAPQNNYDQIIVADMTAYTGAGDGHAVISRSTLEHVKDTKSTIANMGSCVKEGGILIVFAPCRNALFTRLNDWLPESLKRKLLGALYGDQADVMGFEAFYDRCTPSKMKENIQEAGLKMEEETLYWMSNYFAFFFPVHILWRLYQVSVRLFGMNDLCEGFAYVIRK